MNGDETIETEGNKLEKSIENIEENNNAQFMDQVGVITKWILHDSTITMEQKEE